MANMSVSPEQRRRYYRFGRYLVDIFFGFCVLAILPPPILDSAAVWAWRAGIAAFVILLVVPPIRRLLIGINVPLMRAETGAFGIALIGATYFLLFALMIIIVTNSVNRWLYKPNALAFFGRAYYRSWEKFDPGWRNPATATIAESNPDLTGQNEPGNAVKALVTDVVNGDTFMISVDGKQTLVKLIGVKAPEQGLPLAKEAKDLLSSLVDQKTVNLVSDQRDKGPSGELQRYVYSDEIFVNSELVRVGLAFFDDDPINQEYAYLLRELANQAKAKKLGLWAESYQDLSGQNGTAPASPDQQKKELRQKIDPKAKIF